MNLTFIIMTALALSMDAFTVSLSKGMFLKKVNLKLAFKVAFSFGFFQAIMPLIGWKIGIGFSEYIKSIDHIIALILLCFLGVHMIFSKEKDNNQNNLNNLDILLLSIATSIDALAVGISFSFLNISIIPIILCIGVITFALCFVGILIGNTVGSYLGEFAKILGGILLILIGFNIFNEHTNFLRYFF